MNNEIVTIDKETMEKMIEDAHKYTYNLLDFEGDYTEEKYHEELDKLNRDEIFSNDDVIKKETDFVVMTQGYGCFGKDFIKALIDKDPNSAYHVVENVVQDWLDLQEFLRDITKKLEEENNKLKEMKENS